MSDENFKKLLNDPKVDVWRSILLISRMLYYILEGRLVKFKCSLPRLQVLIALKIEGSMAPVKLASRSLVTRGNMSTLLKRMSEEGLIETTTIRGGTPSRPHYKLTEKGNTYLDEIMPEHLENIQDVVPDIPDELANSLKALHTKIHEVNNIGVKLF